MNYDALVALVHRDYPQARALSAETANHADPKYRLASAWISALIAKETLPKEERDPYYDALIEANPDLKSREDARMEIRLAERDLRTLRSDFGVR